MTNEEIEQKAQAVCDNIGPDFGRDMAHAMRELVLKAYEEAAMLSCNCFALETDGHTRECNTTKIRALKDTLRLDRDSNEGNVVSAPEALVFWPKAR